MHNTWKSQQQRPAICIYINKLYGSYRHVHIIIAENAGFKQVIHFPGNHIDIESPGLYVTNFNRLSGLQLNPSLFFKILQCGDNTAAISIIAVQNSLNINISPCFLCRAVFDDSCDKLLPFPLKTVNDICRLAIVFKEIFLKICEFR